jgi:predicted tellurium resistance membrane protein TerC
MDSLIVISALTDKFPAHQQVTAWRIGISRDSVLRLGLLGTMSIIIQITEPVFTALEHGFSWRDLILIWKATKEIHHNSEPGPNLVEVKNISLNVIAIKDLIQVIFKWPSLFRNIPFNRLPHSRL